MDISKSDNVMPDSSPPSLGLEQFVWEKLTPRLIDKVKLSIIRTLLEERKPLPPTKLHEVGGLSECSLELVRYHAKYLSRRVGVLEAVGEAPRPDGQGTEPTYYFPPPSKTSPSPSSTAAV